MRKIQYLKCETWEQVGEACGHAVINQMDRKGHVRLSICVKMKEVGEEHWELRQWSAMERQPETLAERGWKTIGSEVCHYGKMELLMDVEMTEESYLLLYSIDRERWIWISDKRLVMQKKNKKDDTKRDTIQQDAGEKEIRNESREEYSEKQFDWIQPEAMESMKSQADRTDAEWNRVTQKLFGRSQEMGKEHNETKFTQLKRRYGVIYPFGREIEAISMVPAEIHRLPEEYRTLEENSFLLHGFYQYRHILLIQIGDRTKDKKQETMDNQYYLGIPGIFCPQEKRVAEMFGFPEFMESHYGEERCYKRGNRNGVFGYFVRKVDLEAA